MKRNIWLPFLPPGLNGPKGLLRMHHRERSKLRDEVYYMMLSSGANQCPVQMGNVRLVYTRHCIRPMDWDNHGASFKPIGDGLRRLGLVEDDDPSHIVEMVLRQNKVGRRRDEGVMIELEGTI